ncbi:MAG: FkbM family methyltransferase [Gemmatimonadaceae bacterium]
MNDAMRQVTNAAARGLRALKRRLVPGLTARDYALARAYLRWVYDAARLDVVEDVNGHRIHLDDLDSLRLSVNRTFEPAATAFVRRAVRAGDVVLDVGANIGYFSLLLARQVGEAGCVYALEPDPTNFALLERNIAENGYRNVTAMRLAAWSVSGPLRLFRSEENRGDHRTYQSDAGRKSVDVDAVSVDEYVGAQLPAVDFVKIDVQGAEYEAILGMRELLARSPGATLLTELWPRGLRAAGASAERYLELLRDLGFALYELDARGVPRPADLARVLAEHTPENDGYADLLCRRGDLPPGA